jgi:hypothetical protein
VIPEPEVVPNPLIGGTTTYSGKVIAGYNAKISGDGTASDSATAVLNVDYATGELIVEPDEDAQAAINSDVNGGGKQFLTVEARMDESGQINNYAAGTGELANWSPTVAYKTVKHHSESVGTTLGDAFSTIVDGGPPSVGATLKSDGSGYELYETTHYQDLDVYHSGTLSHTLDQIADGNTTLVRRDQEKIDLTGQLQNDQPVWTGTAYREVKGNLEYKDHFDAKYALGAYNKRDAELTKTATYRSDFDPVANQIVKTASNNGAQVGITGSLAMCNGCLFGDGELEVTPHTTLTDYEAALQAIFSDWDINEVIDLGSLQANAGSPGSSLQTNGDSPEGEEPPRQTSVSDLMREFNSHTNSWTPDAIKAAEEVQSFLGEASPLGVYIGIHEAGLGTDFENEVKLSLWQRGLSAIGAGLGILGMTAPIKGFSSGATIPISQLEKKWKHEIDFGIMTTKRNASTLADFQRAIIAHLDDASTVVKGTYQYVPGSTVYFNPNTNLIAILDNAGNFISGWKLNPGTPQFNHLMKNGILR